MGLVQVGLKFEVWVAMSGNVVNRLLLTQYEKLLNELYIELQNEEIPFRREWKKETAKSRQ